MVVENEIFMVGLSLALYLALAITWDFTLFKAKQTNDENNIVKVLVVWLLIWLQPLLIQMAILYAEANSATANMLTLYTVYYEVTIWVGWVISVYFMVFFGYNVMIWLSSVTKKGRS